ncbi:MAG TPA: glycine--tRNA ligase subunit beta [Steroidobacteraceae bacterium]|jgi:glycyl-tRNA synthetase beta chain|nr:glycine--tRNA ligase subunit beta [Steroidobacteraceae bacterium]
MIAQDLLFELLTEELPPRNLLSLSNALTDGMRLGLHTAGIPHGKIHGFATPRRLAVRVERLAEHQPDKQVERRGPPLERAFDAHGAPTQAAIAFAKNCGVAVAELEQLKTDKGAWLIFRGTERGAATTSLLGDIVNRTIAALPMSARMRWGNRTTEFVRPVHGVVLLYGETVVPAEVLGLKTGRVTVGHRFHAPKPLTLKSAKSYEKRLRGAKVVANFAARRELIREGVILAASLTGNGATALIEDALLDEVTALVEWPVPITGRFEHRFLSLPREVVIATVQDHQRYFAVQGTDGLLSGWFVTVSNIASRDPSKVREGNERVVRPRLSDAAFFWDQDLKISLEAHAARLSGVTYQAKLGTYAEKTLRVKALAQLIGGRIGAGMHVARAAELAKADLMSAMVGEFPELQGTMGRYYAEAQGEPEELARALEEHYRPRYAGDSLPTTGTGQAVALADKIDTLVGIFAIEQRPSGAKDPFGLRRAAVGILRILLEGQLELDLFELLAAAAAAQPVQRAQVIDEVYDFIAERLRGMLLEEPGTTAEMLDAVLANRPASPLDAVTRLAALKEFLLLPEARILSAINKRIANILKKTALRSDAAVNAAALTEDAERELHAVLRDLRVPVQEAAAARRYAASLKTLVSLRAPVDNFFDRVMVMDENMERRNNRLALLRDVQLLLGGVADLSRLPG